MSEESWWRASLFVLAMTLLVAAGYVLLVFEVGVALGGIIVGASPMYRRKRRSR